MADILSDCFFFISLGHATISIYHHFQPKIEQLKWSSVVQVFGAMKNFHGKVLWCAMLLTKCETYKKKPQSRDLGQQATICSGKTTCATWCDKTESPTAHISNDVMPWHLALMYSTTATFSTRQSSSSIGACICLSLSLSLSRAPSGPAVPLLSSLSSSFWFSSWAAFYGNIWCRRHHPLYAQLTVAVFAI